MVRGLSLGRLGVLTPAAEQISSQRKRWNGIARDVIVAHASPYGPAKVLDAAASQLRGEAVDAVVMDCIGYTRDMKRRIRGVVKRPVLTAATLLARVVAELLD
jgi:protein AroM